ncbi:fimbrial protein [Escherichia marmotae]|uniref:Pap fimbrial major pilin protein n=1 Tax=Escherichia marmotae TaxID=1499973 RepID=A0A370V5M4_9ESCH|nr:fimbrial protein [Escherichia marmotae]RDR25686.1 Pap fimbrial major pilin protein precursor [Escherichia marmotae]RDR34134.1 Pap fimbrial major pilin protein precursor [Escherichia marmotae]RDR41988.1 Pap fimbrial major pilin protein precursor [Escherichia marmotae]RDR82581.1 Pap fimbrial major pilin protein precursor [Escherichia marmotae]RDS24254.1 Pap fimbrial major pilin protein precursor [Escherichia marmotae]
MKLSKIIMTGAFVSMLASYGVNAASSSHGQGSVTFNGTIIDAPCSIAPDSVNQSIYFGQVSKSHLNAGGISVTQPLNIKLLSCEPNKSVKVSFTGSTVSNDKKALGTTGNTGTAVVISGPDGQLISFDGTAGSSQNLKEGENILNYSTWVKAIAKDSVQEGDFTAVANFNLIYE